MDLEPTVPQDAGVTALTGAPAVTPPTPPPAAPPPPAPAPAYREAEDGKVQILSPRAYSEIKQRAQKKGQLEAIKALGFGSLEEAQKWVNDQRKPSPPPPPAPPAPAPPAPPKTEAKPPQNGNGEERKRNNGHDQDWKRLQRENEKLKLDAQQAKAKKEQARARVKQLQQEKEALEAEQELRVTAAKKGVRDPDYAMHLLRQHLATRSEAELASFDESKYFDDLRETHGYLFGEVVTLANTGPGAGLEPATAPNAAQVLQKTTGKAFDAHKAKPEEVKARLAALGVEAPT